MASFTYPGVYIEELSSGQHTITGVATSIGAFVGWAPMGPVTEATLVESWSDYVAQFGGLDTRSWLGYAVNQFFANGGSECYIVRLVWAEGMEGGVNSPMASATALAAGVGYGTGTITAALGAVSGTIALGVGTPVLESISVTAQGISSATVLPPLPFGASLTLAAAGSFSDGSSSVPPGVLWDTSDATIASVSPAGVVTATGTNSGPVTIYATAGSDSARKHATMLIPSRRGFALRDLLSYGQTSPKLGGGGIFLTQVMDYVRKEEHGTADRIIVITDEQDCDLVNKPSSAHPFGKRNYLINVASYKNGIGYGEWVHIDGWSEAVVEYIRELERSKAE